jgi:hypothetical protein
MASHTNSDDVEDLSLPLSLSQVSSRDFDEGTAPIPQGSALVSRATALPGGGKDDLALASDQLPRPSGAVEEQAINFHSKGPITVDEACLPTPLNGSDDDEGQGPALNLCKLADIVDKSGREPDQWAGSPMAVEDSPALRTPSPGEVRTRHHPCALVDG